MTSHQWMGIALIAMGFFDAVVGWVVSRRMPDAGRRRVFRIAFATSTALIVGLGLTFLLGKRI